MYEQRPAACRKFRCKLLKSAERGEVTWPEALATVAETKRLRTTAAERLEGRLAPDTLPPLIDTARATDPPAAVAGFALLLHLKKHYMKDEKSA